MPETDERYEALKNADINDAVGYTRYLCELYLRDHPDHGPTLLRYVTNLISLAQYSAAQEALDHAEAVIPEKRQHFVRSKRGCLSEARGDFAAAEKLFLEAHELDPNDATYLIYAGSAAFRRGEIDRAIALTRRATACVEGCIDEAYFNLGGYLLSNRCYGEAVECYRRALEIDPNYEIAKERLQDVELILQHQAAQNSPSGGNS